MTCRGDRNFCLAHNHPVGRRQVVVDGDQMAVQDVQVAAQFEHWELDFIRGCAAGGRHDPCMVAQSLVDMRRNAGLPPQSYNYQAVYARMRQFKKEAAESKGAPLSHDLS